MLEHVSLVGLYGFQSITKTLSSSFMWQWLFLFSPFFQTLICANSHTKAREQCGLLTCPHSLKPPEKSPPLSPSMPKMWFCLPTKVNCVSPRGGVLRCLVLSEPVMLWISLALSLRYPFAKPTWPTLLSSQKRGLLCKSFSDKNSISPVTGVSFKTKVLSEPDFSFLWVRRLDVAGDLQPLPVTEGGILGVFILGQC